MQYQTFITRLHEQLSHRLDGQATVSIQSVLKNNGLHLDALCLTPLEDSVSPTIYLRPYYQMYSDGKPFDEILDELSAFFDEYRTTPHPVFQNYFSREQIQSRVVYKLIHTRMNEALLEQVPHIPYLDLSIVFYLFLENAGEAPMSALIYKSHQELWNCSTEDLFTWAKENSPRLLPPTFCSLETILTQALQKQLPEDLSPDSLPLSPEAPPLYVLSNTHSFLGACSILYPKLLKKFADQMETDFILLPSSIHEFLILPVDEAVPFSELNDMITSINTSAVPQEERLSDHAYCYHRALDQITLPPISFKE